MNQGDLFIQEEPNTDALAIYRFQNKLASDGKTLEDEKICLLYSVDLIDKILEVLQVDSPEDIQGYPRMLDDDLIDPTIFNDPTDTIEVYDGTNNTVDED